MSWYNPGNIFGKVGMGAADVATRDVGHAINAGTNLVDRGTLHGGGSALGRELVGESHANAYSPAPFINLASAPQAVSPLGGTASNAGSGGPGGGAKGNAAATVGGGGGGAAVNPAMNANGGTTNFLQNTFSPVLGQMQGAYNTLFGANGQGGELQQAQGQAAANVEKGYQSQIGNLNTNFAQAQEQLPWEYAARGAASSGFANNAYNNAQSIYNNNMSQLQAAQQKDLAGVYQSGKQAQQTAAAEIAAYNSPQFQNQLNNMSNYYQGEQLSNLYNQIAGLRGDIGANTPINTALNNVVNNPSYQQNGSQQIQNQLQALSGSGAPTAIQNQIAQGIIGNPANAGGTNFQNYWQNLQQNPTPVTG